MRKLFLAFTLTMFCASLIAQNGVNLRLSPEKNKVYRFNVTSEQIILQTVNGNQQTIESRTENTMSFKMMDATPNFIVAEVRFDSLSARTNTMGKTVIMTSTVQGNIQSKETADIMSYVMNRLSKTPAYVKIDFTGKVIEIVNGKMISDMIMKDTASVTLTGPMGAAIKTQIKNMVAESTLKQMVESFTRYMPGKAVSKGETWTVSETSNSGGMSLDIATIFKLEGISGDIANMTAETTIKASVNAPPMNAGGGTITYDNLKGLGKSTATADTRTGLVVDLNSKTHIAGNLSFSMPGMSMDIPMDITSESKVAAIR
jgi:hypothetical protein